jgi:hypothetical protein
VLQRVRERLLDEAVGRQVDALRQLGRLALEAQLGREAGLAGLRDELLDVLEARLRHERRGLLGAAEHADEAAHLREGRAAGLLDRAQRLALARLVVAEQPAHGRRLDGHHAHRVADDVVELARDPRALLRDRRERTLLPLELEPLGPLPQRDRLPCARAEDEAGQPGRHEEARDPRQVREAVVELVRDVAERGERDRDAGVRDPPLLRRSEGRHRGERAEEGEREVVAGLPRDRREPGEERERRGRRAEREAVAQEQHRPRGQRERDDRLVVGHRGDRELEDRPECQARDRHVGGVMAAPLHVAVHASQGTAGHGVPHRPRGRPANRPRGRRRIGIPADAVGRARRDHRPDDTDAHRKDSRHERHSRRRAAP